MKRGIFRVLAIMLLSFVILAANSCKKDDDDSKTKTEMLTGKYWKFTAMNISPAIEFNGLEYSDLFGLMPNCTKDDLIKYDANGTVTYDEGPSKCDEGDPQTETGTWSFNSDETKITEVYDGESFTYNLVELSDSNLKISYSEEADYGNGTQTYTITVTAIKN